MLICDDLVPKLNELNFDPKDYIYPESLKDSNPAYALYLESIGAVFTRKIEMVYVIKRFIKNWKYYTFLKKHPIYSRYIKNISRLKYCLFFRPLTIKDESNDDFRNYTPECKCLYKENGVTEYIDMNGHEQKIYHASVRGHL